MMRWLCALHGHPGAILQMDQTRLWTRCLNCWQTSPGIDIGAPSAAEDLVAEEGVVGRVRRWWTRSAFDRPL